jgi:hypothetical protein
MKFRRGAVANVYNFDEEGCVVAPEKVTDGAALVSCMSKGGTWDFDETGACECRVLCI